MKKFLIGLSTVLLILAICLYRPSISIDKLQKKYPSEYSKFIPINGMNAHYHDRGEGIPLLLIHGTSSSLHTWEKWEKALSAEFRVLSIDMPGGGLTGPQPNQEYSDKVYSDFLDDFCTALALDSIYIAGNSLGGKIAWKYASQRENVKKLILVDPSGFYLADKKSPLVFKLGKKKGLSLIVEKLNIKPFIKKSLKEVYYDGDFVTKELVNRYSDFLRVKGNRKAFFEKVGSISLSDEQELTKIKCPTLIQWGKQDNWIPLELSEIFVTNISNQKLVIYDECGHVPQEELASQSAKDALEFLLNE